MATGKQNETFADTLATVLHQDREHTVYHLDDADGEVVQTVYPVFPGIEIVYHDVHATACAMQRTRAPGCLEIHHCREGRIAYPYGDACFFLSPGDLAIVQCSAAAAPARFPTGHYHGITVSIDPARAPDCLSCFLEDVEVRPSALIEKFCADSACFVTRSSQGVAHIFAELYSVPELMRGDRFETFPSFSPAGDKLYFCTADSVEMPARYKEARYSLCSIGFDAASGRLGRDVDTLCNARTTGRSVSFPRVSPDGAFMLYALSDYGTFSIWHRDADLRMIDLRSGREVETSAVNSPEAESYHSWSSNSRWILFNSRRVDGLYTHVYMAHVSDDGTLSNPFLLPQRDPDFYRTFMKSYNIPEFVRGRVTVPVRRIVSAAERQSAVTVSFRMQE